VVKLGMFLQPTHDPARDLTAALEEDRQTVMLADRLGYHEVWVGEHVSCTSEPITDPLVFLATLIGETSQIKLGTGVMCLPHRHPAQVASQAALFDHLSKGRFQMGVGQGSLSSDVQLFGVGGSAAREEMVRESVGHILAIWSSPAPHHHPGAHWTVSVDPLGAPEFGVGEFIRPYQQPHPPLATSIMSPGSRSARMAGEQGWIPISSAAFLHARYTASHWEQYLEGAEAAGRPADPEIWRIVRQVVVAPSDEEAREHVLDPNGALAFWYRYVLGAMRARQALPLVAPAHHPDPELLTWEEMALEQTTFGSPSTVVDRLVALRDLTGHFGVLTTMAVEWTDARFGRRSMELLAREVLPRFAQHAATASAARTF
jgi:alkanesulfonate monooxygenase SsuD/methylene tetrahydromethanopterin reductase-like flavin-dependent oxidoreductase (luciferase family)